MCFLKFKGHLDCEIWDRALLVPGSALFLPKRQEFGAKEIVGGHVPSFQQPLRQSPKGHFAASLNMKIRIG